MDSSSKIKSEEVEEYLKKHLDLKGDYSVIGIIGAQSSGKSTLLNHLYGTNFDTMDEKKRQ